MDIRRVSDMVYHDDDRYKMEEMNKVYYRMADYIRDHHPDAYEGFVMEAEEVAYNMSRTDAENLVLAMRPFGQHWSYDEIKSFVTERGVDSNDVCDYYLVMNMMFNDYNRTAKQYAVDRPEFYYDMAWDFINDEDGPTHKVAKYFMA